MKLLLISLFVISNAQAMQHCVYFKNSGNSTERKCYELTEASTVNTQISQTEKRIKEELIQQIAQTRKEIVLDLLNNPDMREQIKNKIKLIENR
jgi:hypothetical protein